MNQADVVEKNDWQLRPKSFSDYIGQDRVVKTLEIFVSAVKKRGFATEHILLFGPAGIGKTTLAYVIANELKSNIKITSGAALQKPGDLAAILTNLKDNDVFFIDEIHRLPKSVEEILYPVLEEFSLDIIVGSGPSARTVRLSVPKITIVGATTRLALLSAPLRDRFGLTLRLDFYTLEDMKEIIKRTAELLQIKIDDQAVFEIAKRSRGTPRLANRILKRAVDYLSVNNLKVLSYDILIELFSLLEIDDAGLTYLDSKYLETLVLKFNNKPVGLETISSSLSEDKKTIEEFVEPYLIQIGFLKKTPRGRVATDKAQLHLKQNKQLKIF
ncbi:MAG: Holliday junction ATP-dependent DNA helicase RuvB [Patescibacteria group bacterium]|nr:MAG: Holliday junction ATP-dependent DNA helicase RuvB [Patescibacteria group bacterium]